MFNYEQLFAVAVIVLIFGIIVGSSASVLIKFYQGNERAVESTQRRQDAEHNLTEEKKAHAETTRILERRNAICNNCPHCTPGGAA